MITLEDFKKEDLLRFIPPTELKHYTGLSPSWWRDRRLEGSIRENIHYVVVGANKIIYRLYLVVDFAANYQNQGQHNRAVEIALKVLPSNWNLR